MERSGTLALAAVAAATGVALLSRSLRRDIKALPFAGVEDDTAAELDRLRKENVRCQNDPMFSA